MADPVTVFPSLTEVGGVQVSGRLAQTALRGGTIEVSAGDRARAVFGALRANVPPDGVLFWHLSLLKLLPCLRVSRHTRVTLFLHGIEAWTPAGGLTRWLLGRVDLFLSNTDYTWRRFVTANPRFETAAHGVVPLGIGEPLGIRPVEPASVPAALMMGRLARSEDYKGHREMLAAWPQVLRRIPAAQLWVAGDGDLRAELEHIAATRGIGDRVRFLGQISEERKQELLGACRCLALPSRGEGFGLVYLEAMRMGRPCVVSTLDAGQEVVAPPLAGLSADPSNPERLADAVSELLTVNHAWHLRSGAARQRYAQQFTALHFQERLRAALTAATTSSEHVRHRRRPAA